MELTQSSEHHETIKEVERLKLMNKWNLLHYNASKSINRTIKGLEEKLEFYKNDEEMCKTINSILKRINLYNTNIFAKLDIYTKILNEKKLKVFLFHFLRPVG